MSGPILLAVPLALLLSFLSAARRRTRLAADPAALPGMAELDRIQWGHRWRGLALAGCAAALAALIGDFGRGVFLAPLIVAIVLVGSLAVAEARVWRLARTPGKAALEDRRPAGYLPSVLMGILGVCAAVLVALFVIFRSHQSPTADDMGTIGREWFWASADGMNTQSGSPYPGSFYSTPACIALGVLGIVLAVGIVLTLRRPRNGTEPTLVAIDDDARRRTIAAMGAAALVGVAGTFAASLLMAAPAGRHYFPNTVTALVAAVVAMVVGAWAGAIYLVPGTPRRPCAGDSAVNGVQR